MNHTSLRIPFALLVAAATAPGCVSRSAEDYYEWKFRDTPVRAAYFAYWDAAGDVGDALLDAKFSSAAPSTAYSVVPRIRSAYRQAGSAAHDFSDRKSPFLEDAEKMRASANSKMKVAMDSFGSQVKNLRKWIDNYYEIEAKVTRANELARLAFESTGTQ